MSLSFQANCSFSRLNIIPITYKDVVPYLSYFNKLIHTYGCNLNKMRSPFNDFTIANSGHPVSNRPWARICSMMFRGYSLGATRTFYQGKIISLSTHT